MAHATLTWPEPRSTERAETDAARDAEASFRRGQEQVYRRTLAVGLILSVVAHFALIQLVPAVRVAEVGRGGGSMEAVELPPEVKVPPPPEQIARPATPTVAEASVSEDVTISPTTFEANPVEKLPPPPQAGAGRPSDRPSFIPHDTPPQLTNRAEVTKLLQRHYPPGLRETGIGGRVLLWIFVDEEGEVTKTLVKEPSRYSSFDDAAQKVASSMEFKPALNRDQAIGVWISQSIRFSVQS